MLGRQGWRDKGRYFNIGGTSEKAQNPGWEIRLRTPRQGLVRM